MEIIFTFGSYYFFVVLTTFGSYISTERERKKGLWRSVTTVFLRKSNRYTKTKINLT